MAVLEVNGLKKVYTTRFGGSRVQALTNVTFAVERGEYVAIMGESGSGKTTLLNILAALDRPTEGEVFLNGRALSTIGEKEIASFRRQNLGFVFQDSNLLDTFTLLITSPQILLADEPTGALDSRASDSLLSLFGEINRAGQTILMVTHSTKAASHAGRVLFIKDGVVFHQIYRGGSTNEEMFHRISDTLTAMAAGA